MHEGVRAGSRDDGLTQRDAVRRTLDSLARAGAELEAANAVLDVDDLTASEARALLRAYTSIVNKAQFGQAALARRAADAEGLAELAGTSVTEARRTLATGDALAGSPALSGALSKGELSLAQASEIAKAEQASPGAAEELVDLARRSSFQTLRNEARRVAAQASQGPSLAQKQKEARSASSWSDELGMVNIRLRLQPQVGTPIVSRAEAEAARLARAARAEGSFEPYERHLADAYVKVFSGNAVSPHPSRPELVVVVDHAVAQRGWKDVRPNERCKVPGVGPLPPEVARELAEQAVISIAVEEGTDLRHFKRFGRARPKELDLALRLGTPPAFDGPACVDCGKRLGLEGDHAVPLSAGGETSYANSRWRCRACHHEKTRHERAQGLYRKAAATAPAGKDADRAPGGRGAAEDARASSGGGGAREQGAHAPVQANAGQRAHGPGTCRARRGKGVGPYQQAGLHQREESPSSYPQKGEENPISLTITGVKDGPGTYRLITSRTSRSEIVLNQGVCRYGRTSGYACGYVEFEGLSAKHRGCELQRDVHRSEG